MPFTHANWSLLESIDSPADVRKLNNLQLKELSRQLREFLLKSVASTGGHFSAGLGTVELTVALHYVFNTPYDRLVWDVGHQTYPHKILTGRREQMTTLRQKGGIAGFPKREESEYDSFGTGHSSTSISAALGMSIAARQNNENRHCVAIIGDGAMTAGMAFEALNHAGAMPNIKDANLLVILNDNDMSISPNVGALSNHLTRLLSGDLFSTLREGGKKVLENIPPALELARRTEEHVKGMVAPSTLFEELGFNYFGPVDGHDLDTLIPVLQNINQHSGPRLLHIQTQKGKGYFPAEDAPVKYHAVSSFDLSTGKAHAAATQKPPSYTEIFGQWLCDMATQDERLIGITPAMREGSGMVEFAQRFPQRYFDVGIAEQHAVTLAAGMACEGVKPVVAIYSTFLQRAYDQLIHDVAIQNLPVMFAIDRAGIVGADGPTHTGAYDISFLRCIPNMVIMTPANAAECRGLLTTAFLHDGPSAVRYPRGAAADLDHDEQGNGENKLTALPFAQGVQTRAGKKVALLVFGSLLSTALEVAEKLDASVYNMRFVKPLDNRLIDEALAQHDLLVTVEDNAIAGGAGSAVCEYLNSQQQNAEQPSAHVLQIGFPDEFINHGQPEELLSDWKLDTQGMIESIQARIKELLI